MNRITPQERPTFKVAHSYRSHGFISRETFLSFQKTFEEIVTTIVNIKVCKDEDDLWKYVRSLFAFDDYADCVPINATNLSVVFNAVQLSMNAMALDWNRESFHPEADQAFCVHHPGSTDPHRLPAECGTRPDCFL